MTPADFRAAMACDFSATLNTDDFKPLDPNSFAITRADVYTDGAQFGQSSADSLAWLSLGGTIPKEDSDEPANKTLYFCGTQGIGGDFYQLTRGFPQCIPSSLVDVNVSHYRDADGNLHTRNLQREPREHPLLSGENQSFYLPTSLPFLTVTPAINHLSVTVRGIVSRQNDGTIEGLGIYDTNLYRCADVEMATEALAQGRLLVSHQPSTRNTIDATDHFQKLRNDLLNNSDPETIANVAHSIIFHIAQNRSIATIEKKRLFGAIMMAVLRVNNDDLLLAVLKQITELNNELSFVKNYKDLLGPIFKQMLAMTSSNSTEAVMILNLQMRMGLFKISADS